MITHEHKIRIRYGETDKMSYVYYGTYPLFYEEARTELMRSVGMSYKDLEDAGYMLPVHTMNIEYIKPAYYDDLLTIKTTLKDYPSARLVFYYEVYNQQGTLINRAKTELIFLNSQNMKPCRAPKIFLDLLNKYF